MNLSVCLSKQEPRRYKHRGRGVSQGGRRHKEVERRSQMCVTDTSEIVWHQIQTRKKPRLQLEHSLDLAVTNNRMQKSIRI